MVSVAPWVPRLKRKAWYYIGRINKNVFEFYVHKSAYFFFNPAGSDSIRPRIKLCVYRRFLVPETSC